MIAGVSFCSELWKPRKNLEKLLGFIGQRAYENGMFVLFRHPGESVVISPEGRIIAATCGWENVVVRSIDPGEAVGRGCFGSKAMARTYFIDADGSAHHRRRREKRAKKQPSRP